MNRLDMIIASENDVIDGGEIMLASTVEKVERMLSNRHNACALIKHQPHDVNETDVTSSEMSLNLVLRAETIAPLAT